MFKKASNIKLHENPSFRKTNFSIQTYGRTYRLDRNDEAIFKMCLCWNDPKDFKKSIKYQISGTSVLSRDRFFHIDIRTDLRIRQTWRSYFKVWLCWKDLKDLKKKASDIKLHENPSFRKTNFSIQTYGRTYGLDRHDEAIFKVCLCWNDPKDFQKSIKYQISLTSVFRETNFSIQTYGRTYELDRHDETNLKCVCAHYKGIQGRGCIYVFFLDQGTRRKRVGRIRTSCSASDGTI